MTAPDDDFAAFLIAEFDTRFDQLMQFSAGRDEDDALFSNLSAALMKAGHGDHVAKRVSALAARSTEHFARIAERDAANADPANSERLLADFDARFDELMSTGSYPGGNGAYDADADALIKAGFSDHVAARKAEFQAGLDRKLHAAMDVTRPESAEVDASNGLKSIPAEVRLAVSDAEDGALAVSEAALNKLVDRVNREIAVNGRTSAALDKLCVCVLERAQVRAWAVRPHDALADLDLFEECRDELTDFDKFRHQSNALQIRVGLFTQVASPLYNIDKAEKAHTELVQIFAPSEVANLGLLVGSLAPGWTPVTTELKLATSRDDYAKMIECSLKLREVFEAKGQVGGVYRAQLMAATGYIGDGRFAEAEPHARAAFEHFSDSGPPGLMANSALALALAGRREEDWPFAEMAVALAEEQTRKQANLFDQQRFLIEKMRIFDEALRLAIALMPDSADGDAQANVVLRAWQIGERAKSFSLRQAMTQGGWQDALDPENARRIEQLDGLLEVFARQDGLEGGATKQLNAKQAERTQLFQQMLHKKPDAVAPLAPPELDLNAVLGGLPQSVGVISWYWLKEPDHWKLNIFHCGADRVPRHVFTKWTHDEVDKLSTNQQALGSENPLQIKSTYLAEIATMIFPEPVLDAMAGCDTLLITPHRHLQQMPVHATTLPASGPGGKSTFLIERFAVQILPSLALRFPPSGQNDGPHHILALGCEKDGAGNRALPDVPKQIQAIAELWKTGGHAVSDHCLSSIQGLDGEISLTNWRDFDIIHLACHGQFFPDRPFEASLYLGKDAVRADEFFKIKLKSEVICLSACDVGQRSDQLNDLKLVSDEWLGLALPLFQAGARNLLTSLWRADAEHARVFMTDFHQSMSKGLSPAHAHRQACLRQIENRSVFGFWVNWQLAGFPVQIIVDV